MNESREISEKLIDELVRQTILAGRPSMRARIYRLRWRVTNPDMVVTLKLFLLMEFMAPETIETT